jgi:hypothetical protein
MPPLPGRRGTRRSLRKRAAAGLDELELEPWVSLWSNHSGEESTPPSLAWTEGNKMLPPRRLEGGEQGVPERPNPLRKNRSIRGFCFSPNKLNGKPDSRHNGKNICEDFLTSIYFFASGCFSDTKPFRVGVGVGF